MSTESQKLTRRKFFARLANSVTDRLGSVGEKEINRNSWINLVRLSEMTPGRVFQYECDEARGVLYSNAIGVYAVTEDMRRPALRVTPHGCIEMHLIDEWRTDQILSHMTGLLMRSAEGDVGI